MSVDRSATRPPELNATRLKGGLGHLSEEARTNITEARFVPKHLCCEDPAWLYRIYSDTIVDVIGKVVAMAESLIM